MKDELGQLVFNLEVALESKAALIFIVSQNATVFHSLVISRVCGDLRHVRRQSINPG